MDTPAVPAPKDSREQEILENLSAIRDQLLLLKQDRTKYVRTQDVMVLYNQTVEQVKQVREIRQGQDIEENRLDKVLESCFQLISLFFMTVGRTTEAPAAYALTSTIRRLLDHLAEANLFSAKDLESMSQTLDKLTENNASSRHSPYLVELIAHRVEKCQASLQKLQQQLDGMAEPLVATHEKLISIIRTMAYANTRSRFNSKEHEDLVVRLNEIAAQRVDGKFRNVAGEPLAGSDTISELLDRCLKWSDIVRDRKGAIPDNFSPLYQVLVGIRNELEKLSMTHSWSLRETDLYDFQRQLDKIDEARVEGNWLDNEGRPAELYVQRTLLYLIRRCYGYIYTLMIASEPVSEALLPIYNQLQTLKRCLNEVKRSGGVASARELYPYSMKLHSIDNMRVDGKFMVSGDIPEGQGSVSELLAECFELNYELRVAAESDGADTD